MYWIRTEININDFINMSTQAVRDCTVNTTSKSKHQKELTLSDDQWGEKEKVAHQLGRHLVKQAASSGTVKRSAAIPHYIHQSNCQ